MIDYYKKVVFENYANFQGRASRAEFWWFFLANAILNIIFNIFFTVINLPKLVGIYSIAVLVPTIAVWIRRMHDINKSGWYSLIPIYDFVLAATKGDNGNNEFGPDPYGYDEEIDTIGTVE